MTDAKGAQAFPESFFHVWLKKWRLLFATLQDLKDLLVRFWYMIPKDNFRGLMESMPQCPKAVLGVRGGGPSHY